MNSLDYLFERDPLRNLDPVCGLLDERKVYRGPCTHHPRPITAVAHQKDTTYSSSLAGFYDRTYIDPPTR